MQETTSSPTPPGRRHEHAECERCPLNRPSAKFCPPAGPSDAKLVIVGEAPGQQEAEKGVPFSGPSGHLLDSILRHHDIDRRDVFLTNAVLCRPPSNKIGPKEVAACAPRLRWEIEQVRPDTVITLGNTSTRVLSGSSEGITSARVGPPKRRRLGDEVEFDHIATFHPAASLRSPDYFPFIVADVGKSRAGVHVRWEPPRYKAITDPHVATEVLREMGSRTDRLVVDIETGAEKDDVQEYARRRNIICVGLGYAPGRVIVVGEQAMASEETTQALGELLARTPNITMQNGKFDMQALWRYNEDIRMTFDTMLASYAQDERRGVHSLDWQGQEHIGTPDWKGEMHPYLDKERGYQDAPRGKLYKYNALDVAATWDLEDFHRSRMGADEKRVHDLLVEASAPLGQAELEGIAIDLEYNDALWTESTQHLEALKARDSLGAYLDNPNSWQQVQRALSEIMGSPYTASTDEDHLTHLRDAAVAKKHDELVRFINLMLEWREEAKSFGTYIKGIRSRVYDGRLHTTFLLHGTTTGRLASRNPNLQNVTRGHKIRRQFVPAEGHLFVQADYATVELRVVAIEANDPYLIGLFRDGRDIHNEVSDQLFGAGNWGKEQRVRAKAVVYGLSYGREAYSLAQEYRMGEREAQKYLDGFFGMIPETVKWKEGIKSRVFAAHEDLVTHFGRHRRRYLITPQNKKDIEKESYAFIPQSTASDITLSAAIRLRRDHGLHLLIPVHDSLLVECPAEDAEDVGRLMQQVMEDTAKEVYSDKVPFPVDVQIGESWGDV